MNVIWKRPDGFHGASPSDYVVVQVATNSKIWLHKTDNCNFPFRISGGWQDEDATEKLNNLVNLLNKKQEDWIQHLLDCFSNSQAENGKNYIESQEKWLGELKENLKGDQWETTIMIEVLTEVEQMIHKVANDFLTEAQRLA